MMSSLPEAIGAGVLALIPVAMIAMLIKFVRLHLRYRRFFKEHARPRHAKTRRR